MMRIEDLSPSSVSAQLGNEIEEISKGHAASASTLGTRMLPLRVLPQDQVLWGLHPASALHAQSMLEQAWATCTHRPMGELTSAHRLAMVYPSFLNFPDFSDGYRQTLLHHEPLAVSDEVWGCESVDCTSEEYTEDLGHSSGSSSRESASSGCNHGYSTRSKANASNKRARVDDSDDALRHDHLSSTSTQDASRVPTALCEVHDISEDSAPSRCEQLLQKWPDQEAPFGKEGRDYKRKRDKYKHQKDGTGDRVQLHKERNRFHAQCARERRRRDIDDLKNELALALLRRQAVQHEIEQTPAAKVSRTAHFSRVVDTYLKCRFAGEGRSHKWQDLVVPEFELHVPCCALPGEQTPNGADNSATLRTLRSSSELSDDFELTQQFVRYVQAFARRSGVAATGVATALDLSSVVAVGNTLMGSWTLWLASDTGPTHMILDGMLTSIFDVVKGRILRLELTYDPRSVDAQLKQLAATHKVTQDMALSRPPAAR